MSVLCQEFGGAADAPRDHRAFEYRLRAINCVSVASAVDDDEARIRLLLLARHWRHLAELAKVKSTPR